MALNFSELSSRKVAGVPIVWVAAIVMVALLYGAIRMKPAADVSGDPEESTEDESGDFNTDQPVFAATPVIMQPSGPSVASTPMEDTNELWGRRAIEWLTANGFSLTMATTAVAKYLDGSALTFEEGRARDKAVAHFGLPPEGILTTSTGRAPESPASTQGTPPTTHTVRGSRDNTTAELARLYYGIANADAVNLIDAKNPTLVKPYPKGTRVRIPAFRQPRYYVATSATRTLYAIARKNGTTPQAVSELNPGMKFPVKVGTRVRVR